MKTYTKSIVERESLSKVTCDLCKRECCNGSRWNRADPFYQSDVTVSCREGTYYPETQSGSTIEVDICPDCFKDKLMPWLRSQGAAVEEREW